VVGPELLSITEATIINNDGLRLLRQHFLDNDAFVGLQCVAEATGDEISSTGWTADNFKPLLKLLKRTTLNDLVLQLIKVVDAIIVSLEVFEERSKAVSTSMTQPTASPSNFMGPIPKSDSSSPAAARYEETVVDITVAHATPSPKQDPPIPQPADVHGYTSLTGSMTPPGSPPMSPMSVCSDHPGTVELPNSYHWSIGGGPAHSYAAQTEPIIQEASQLTPWPSAPIPTAFFIQHSVPTKPFEQSTLTSAPVFSNIVSAPPPRQSPLQIAPFGGNPLGVSSFGQPSGQTMKSQPTVQEKALDQPPGRNYLLGRSLLERGRSDQFPPKRTLQTDIGLETSKLPSPSPTFTANTQRDVTDSTYLPETQCSLMQTESSHCTDIVASQSSGHVGNSASHDAVAPKPISANQSPVQRFTASGKPIYPEPKGNAGRPCPNAVRGKACGQSSCMHVHNLKTIKCRAFAARGTLQPWSEVGHMQILVLYGLYESGSVCTVCEQ
jgi:hypothetical protein